jgi:hypothetical protein
MLVVAVNHTDEPAVLVAGGATHALPPLGGGCFPA